MRSGGKGKPFAKKSLGQNFLVDPGYITKIVDAVNIQPGETVLEIGPGRAALTERLVEKPANVIAVELDRDLVPQLEERFESASNLTIIESDALEFDLTSLISSHRKSTIENHKLKLVANLPYYISTAILQRLIEQRTAFSLMVLMFQKEVVDRITAEPGNSERGFLTVLTEAFFNVKKLFDVPPTAFHPQPKVWSSIVRITPKESKMADEKAFRELVSNSFRQKRKTILNNLKYSFPGAADILKSADIDPKRRPEGLTLNEWIRLASHF